MSEATFASHYSCTMSLAQALSASAIAAYNKRAAGEKYLFNPNMDVAPKIFLSEWRFKLRCSKGVSFVCS